MIYMISKGRALDKLYFQKSTVLIHFEKKSNQKFLGVLPVCLKKHTQRNDKAISTCCLIEPVLTACFLRLFIYKKANSKIMNFSLA